MKNFLLDLLFPKQCIGCQQNDTWLCDDCFSLIQLNQTRCCYLCRKRNQNGQTCASHLRTNNRLDGLLVATHYDGNPILKKAIKELKFHRHQEIAEKLGTLLRCSDRLKPIPTTLIPVPLHPNRLKQRGFNQAELLAKNISGLNFQLQTSNSKLLLRTRDTLSQVQCRDRQTRLKNPQGAFTVNGKIDPEIIYVLIDDLVTTGATLEECCRVLKINGAKTVWGLVLARN